MIAHIFDVLYIYIFRLPTTANIVTDWYLDRAYEIEELSGQVTFVDVSIVILR